MIEALTAPALNRTMVAVTPQELPYAQADLAKWCTEKMRELGGNCRDLASNLRIAKVNKWRHSGLKNALAREKKRIVYYDKIRKAVAAGYLVIPNFDVDVIAVRVERSEPRNVGGPNDRIVGEAVPELLPAHSGRYVSGRTDVQDYSRTTTENGRTTKHEFYRPGDYRDVDFPMIELKPQLLEATSEAMRHHIFDRIGIVRGRLKADPIIVGQILDPRNGNQSWYRQLKCATFFIGWWLDTRNL